MDKAKSLSTPMLGKSLNIDNDPFRTCEEDEDILGPEVLYLSAIVALMYLTNCTIPDISFAVNLLSRFNHVVSCAEIIGIEHCHNVVRDTLVDICYHSGSSAGNEVDIGLDGGRGKPLRLTDKLLYSWVGRLDAVTDDAQRKRDKYMDRCAALGYGFLQFSFSSLEELEAYAVILLKQIQSFCITQDIGARATIHIFNWISFTIAKSVGLR
nr:copia protein [Tanacetum cinerariifolium]